VIGARSLRWQFRLAGVGNGGFPLDRARRHDAINRIVARTSALDRERSQALASREMAGKALDRQGAMTPKKTDPGRITRVGQPSSAPQSHHRSTETWWVRAGWGENTLAGPEVFGLEGLLSRA